MSWFKSNKTRRKRRSPAKPAATDRAPWRGRAALGVLRRVWIVVLIAAGVWGIDRLEGYVRGRPEFRRSARIVLTDAPDDLHDRILEVIAPRTGGSWADPGLCRGIAEALDASAWVREVRRVRRFADGTIAVSCDYRTPAALVQVDGGYYLVAQDGVRLPGRFSYHPSFVVVQGTAALPPEPGEAWPGRDMKASLDIVRRLQVEPFFDQLTGVLVGNYHGRLNKKGPHIVLATAPVGGRIVWGSAPGEEIEENTVEQKLMLLWENYRRWGRIDAGRDYIDISTYPDRFSTRAPA